MATYYGSWGSKSQSWGRSSARLRLDVTEYRYDMTEYFKVDVVFENNHSLSYNLNLNVAEYREGADPYKYTRKNSDVSISTPSGGATRVLYSYTSGDFSRFTTDRTIEIVATLESCQFYPQLTVTATFKIPKRDSWIIDYNGNGATSGSVSSQTKWRNTDITVKSNGFTKTGYTFNNWYSSYGEKMYNPGATYSANGGTTMRAQWSANKYTVIYNPNGGSGSIAKAEATYDSYFTLQKIGYEKTGYEFNGWATTNTATTAQYKVGDRVRNLTTTNNGIVNLYAVWKPITYSIIYDPGDDKIFERMADSSHVYDVPKNLSRNTYVKTGYDFQHWLASSDDSNSSLNGAIFADSQNVINLTTDKTEIITLTAIWAIHNYRENYNYNIDELDDKYLSNKDKEYLNTNLVLYQNIPYDTKYQLPKVELSCYRIDYWYCIDADGKKIEIGTPLEELTYDIAENRTLYAKWKLYGIPINYYVGNIKVEANEKNNLLVNGSTTLYDLPNFPGKKLNPDKDGNCWTLRGTNKKYSLIDILKYEEFQNYSELNFVAEVTNTTMKYEYVGDQTVYSTYKDYFEIEKNPDDYTQINNRPGSDYICWQYGGSYYFKGDLFPNIATANDDNKTVFQFMPLPKENFNFIITKYQSIAEDFKQYKFNKTDEGDSYSLSNSLFYYVDNTTPVLTNKPKRGTTYYVIPVNYTEKEKITILPFPLQPNQQFEGWTNSNGEFITDNQGKIINKKLFENNNITITNLTAETKACSEIEPRFNLVSENYIAKTEQNTWENLYTTMWVNNNNFSNSLIYPYKLGQALDFVIGTFKFYVIGDSNYGFEDGTLTGYKNEERSLDND